MNKQATYEQLIPQIKAICEDESNLQANQANMIAILHEHFGFWWTGVYKADNKQLVLNSFQGPVACTRIDFGKGVCGKAWELEQTMIVPNVHEFEGHIACSAASNSEIVLPIYRDGTFYGVLDIDSTDFNTFDETDGKYLKRIIDIVYNEMG